MLPFTELPRSIPGPETQLCFTSLPSARLDLRISLFICSGKISSSVLVYRSSKGIKGLVPERIEGKVSISLMFIVIRVPVSKLGAGACPAPEKWMTASPLGLIGNKGNIDFDVHEWVEIGAKRYRNMNPLWPAGRWIAFAFQLGSRHSFFADSLTRSCVEPHLSTGMAVRTQKILMIRLTIWYNYGNLQKIR